MKLSRLSFALILTTLVLALKCGKRKINEPSGDRNRDKNNSCASNEQGQPINKRIYSVNMQPNAANQDRYKEEKNYWKRQIRVSKCLNWITLATAVVGVSGLLYLKWTLDQSREFFDATQRARVLLGNKDGKLAEFRLGGKKPVIVLYFYNAGPTRAVDFAVRTSSNLAQPNEVSEPELNRYLGSYGGRVKSTSQPTKPIAGNSKQVEYLGSQFTPSKEQLTEIRNGRRYSIQGIYIYCDDFGRYSSEYFSIQYVPPPIDDFVLAVSYTPDTSQISDPPKPNMMEGHTFTPLSRCEQLGEREELKKKKGNTGLPSPP